MEGKRNKLLDLLAQTEDLATELRQDLASDSESRINVVEKSKRLTRTLQTPVDQAWDIFYQPHHLSTLCTALDAGWLEALDEADGHGLTAGQLAASSGGDVTLVRRLMRYLAATGSVKEVELDTYATADMSTFLSNSATAAGLRHAAHDYAAPLAKMPQYFANNGYQSPPNAEEGIHASVYGTSLFKYHKHHPAVAESFHTFMSAVNQGKKSWLDVFPIQKLQVPTQDDILLVDVGGGRGHELAKFTAWKFSLGLLGKLILQDRPEVLNHIPEEWHNLFVAQTHDFFTPQPAISTHARAYYMRKVLHDRSDADCVRILTHARNAMKPGYSMLLINEIVLPDTRCSLWQAAFDISIMAAISGGERTSVEWNAIISAVDGLFVERTWLLDPSGESIIEVSKREYPGIRNGHAGDQ